MTQQFPGFAVGKDGPAADNPRIEEIKAFFARPIDLPVFLADQHCLTLVDGDLRRADLDLDRHVVLPWLSVTKQASLASSTTAVDALRSSLDASDDAALTKYHAK
jgi:hypothetical protein